MNIHQPYETEFLWSMITDSKQKTIQQVLRYRTRYVSVLLEGIGQPHNASAALRSCDIFGVQDIHVVEKNRKFTPHNEISKGASKWLTIERYASVERCINTLKQAGYRMVATAPHENGYRLDQVPLDQKMVLMFGTELTGLSATALSYADECVTIPMFGFTQSFNISVTVSLCLYDVMNRLRASSYAWPLTATEQEHLKRVWLERILHMAQW